MSLFEHLIFLRTIEKDSIYEYMMLEKFSSSGLGLKDDPLTLFALDFQGRTQERSRRVEQRGPPVLHNF